MKTILLNVFFIALVLLISGCCEVVKLETTSSEKQVIDEKQDANAFGWILGLCEDAVTLSCKTVFPEDSEGHRSDYADAPTYQQWQNIETFNCFLAVLEALANGIDSGSEFRMTDPYRWHEVQRYGPHGYYDPWMR